MAPIEDRLRHRSATYSCRSVRVCLDKSASVADCVAGLYIVDHIHERSERALQVGEVLGEQGPGSRGLCCLCGLFTIYHWSFAGVVENVYMRYRRYLKLAVEFLLLQNRKRWSMICRFLPD
jgi:hypothetical protein